MSKPIKTSITKSSIARMAGNIAAGFVSGKSGEINLDVVADHSVNLALRITLLVEERVKDV